MTTSNQGPRLKRELACQPCHARAGERCPITRKTFRCDPEAERKMKRRRRKIKNIPNNKRTTSIVYLHIYICAAYCIGLIGKKSIVLFTVSDFFFFNFAYRANSSSICILCADLKKNNTHRYSFKNIPHHTQLRCLSPFVNFHSHFTFISTILKFNCVRLDHFGTDLQNASLIFTPKYFNHILL